MQRNDKIKSGLLLYNQVYPLRIPLLLSIDETFKQHTLFNGITEGLSEISCHAAALSFGYSPHAPHSHKGEHLLILLSGNLNLIFLDELSSDKLKSIPIKKGQFIYYSSYFTHAIKTTSKAPANYLIFSWYVGLKNIASFPTFNCFNMFDKIEYSDFKNGFYSQDIFKRTTGYLKKLNCNISILMPGVDYKPHIDTYDVAIVILEGEVETMGQKVKPYDVIFWLRGEHNGMQNIGTTPARYIVFEFHIFNKVLTGKIFNIFSYLLTRLSEKGRLKRKLKKFFKFFK
jgi:uncharacterized RmlC-like cupin family protein